MSYLADEALPRYFISADQRSKRAQRLTLILSGTRLLGGLAAAVGALAAVPDEPGSAGAFVCLSGFLAAFVAELLLIVLRPEAAWYRMRAAAESAKTLSWRYSVCAEPFLETVSPTDADRLLRARLHDVHEEVSPDAAHPSGDFDPTAAMRALRALPFAVRRKVYLEERTDRQQRWYVDKSEVNRRWSIGIRVSLICAEVIAVLLATQALFAGSVADLAGLVAASMAALAAWASLRQHETLRTAYALTASELSRQSFALTNVSQADWAPSVADAEEAISREHTMWLASRGSSAAAH